MAAFRSDIVIDKLWVLLMCRTDFVSFLIKEIGRIWHQKGTGYIELKLRTF
jgi:hypothetical protein